MEGCTGGLFGRWFGHKFRPRYTEEPSGVEIGRVRGVDGEEVRRLLILQEYIGDVCTRCGTTIKPRKRDV